MTGAIAVSMIPQPNPWVKPTRSLLRPARVAYLKH
jgi:hypothetical protein